MQCKIKDFNFDKNITGKFFNGYYTDNIFTICVTQKYVNNYIKNLNFTNNIIFSIFCSVGVYFILMLIVELIVYLARLFGFNNQIISTQITPYNSLENEKLENNLNDDCII